MGPYKYIVYKNIAFILLFLYNNYGMPFNLWLNDILNKCLVISHKYSLKKQL